jgi:hypothetical protein
LADGAAGKVHACDCYVGMAFFLAIYATAIGGTSQCSCCADARIREKKRLRISKLKQEKEQNKKQPFCYLFFGVVFFMLWSI